MNKDISPIVVIPVAVIIVGVLIFFGIRAMSPPPSGGSYTPGVPPWKDPQLKAVYASGKAQPWRSVNDWHPSGQVAPAQTPTAGPPGTIK